MRTELARNKEELETRLGRPVRFLAWPGNAWSRGLRRLALEELGFAATTESAGLNRPGDDPTWLGRVHIESNFEDGFWVWIDKWEFIAKVQLFRGNLWYLALAVPAALMRHFLLGWRRLRRPDKAAPVPEGAGVTEGIP